MFSGLCAYMHKVEPETIHTPVKFVIFKITFIKGILVFFTTVELMNKKRSERKTKREEKLYFIEVLFKIGLKKVYPKLFIPIT